MADDEALAKLMLNLSDTMYKVQLEIYSEALENLRDLIGSRHVDLVQRIGYTKAFLDDYIKELKDE